MTAWTAACLGAPGAEALWTEAQRAQRGYRVRLLSRTDVSLLVNRVDPALAERQRLRARGVHAVLDAWADGGAVPLRRASQGDAASTRVHVVADDHGVRFGAARDAARAVAGADDGRVFVRLLVPVAEWPGGDEPPPRCWRLGRGVWRDYWVRAY